MHDDEEPIPRDDLNPRGLKEIETSKTTSVHTHHDQTVKQELKSKIDILISELEELKLNIKDVQGAESNISKENMSSCNSNHDVLNSQKEDTRANYDQRGKSASMKFRDVKRGDIDNDEDINLQQDELCQPMGANTSNDLCRNKFALIKFITGVVLDEIRSKNHQNDLEHQIGQVPCIILKLFENLTPNTDLHQSPSFDRNTFSLRSFHDCYGHGDGNGVTCFNKNNNFPRTNYLLSTISSPSEQRERDYAAWKAFMQYVTNDARVGHYVEDIQKRSSNYQTPLFHSMYASTGRRERRSAQIEGDTLSEFTDGIFNFFGSTIKRVLNDVFPNPNGDSEGNNLFQEKYHNVHVQEAVSQNDENMRHVEWKKSLESDERYGEETSEYESFINTPMEMNVNAKEVVENVDNDTRDTKDTRENKASNILASNLIDAIFKAARNGKLHSPRNSNEGVDDVTLNLIENVEHVDARQKTKETETPIKNNRENYSKKIEDDTELWNDPSADRELSKTRSRRELMTSPIKQLIKKRRRIKRDMNDEDVMNKFMDVMDIVFEKLQHLEAESNYSASTERVKEKPVSLKNSERHANNWEKLLFGKFDDTRGRSGEFVLSSLRRRIWTN